MITVYNPPPHPFIGWTIKQGRSSSIGAKILSFVLRLLTDDFKEENAEKESVQEGRGEEGRGGEKRAMY